MCWNQTQRGLSFEIVLLPNMFGAKDIMRLFLLSNEGFKTLSGRPKRKIIEDSALLTTTSVNLALAAVIKEVLRLVAIHSSLKDNSPHLHQIHFGTILAHKCHS